MLLVFFKSQLTIAAHTWLQKLQGEVNHCSTKTWPDDKDNMLSALELLVKVSPYHHSLQTFFSTHVI